MKISKRLQVAIGALFVAGFLAATPAVAQTVGGYGGASVGLSSSKDFNDLCSDLGASCDKNPLGLKLFGGYQFNQNFAVEGGYYSTGDFEARLGGGSGTISATTLYVAAVGLMPVSPTVSIFGKLGMHFWNVDASGFGGSASDDGNDPMFGFGAKFAVSKTVAVRVEYEQYNATSEGESFNVNFLSAGVEMKF